MRCFEIQTNIVYKWIIVRNRINGDEFDIARYGRGIDRAWEPCVQTWGVNVIII